MGGRGNPGTIPAWGTTPQNAPIGSNPPSGNDSARWANGWNSNQCGVCRREGKDALHDWQACQKRRRAEAAATTEAVPIGNPPTDSRRAVSTLSVLRIDPIRLEGEGKRVKDVRLTLDIILTFAPGITRKIGALIDTGAEVNLLRRGIAFPEYLTPVKHPLRLATASQDPLPGGDREVRCMATMKGREIDSGEERTI